LEGDQYAEAPKDMGTGVAGVWGQHHFILTASHVLEGAEPGDLLAFCRPSGDLVYRTTSQVTIENSVPPVKCTDQDSKIHRCPWEDLAVVTTKASILGPDIEFVNIANSWIDPPEGETVHCVGYPTDNRVLVDSQRVGLVTHRSLAFYADVFSGDVLPCPVMTN
jgi:Trypsin-like peptidase domain